LAKDQVKRSSQDRYRTRAFRPDGFYTISRPENATTNPNLGIVRLFSPAHRKNLNASQLAGYARRPENGISLA
jgi:hypothetical protein